MTKKDYELIARAIKEMADLPTNEQASTAISAVAHNIAQHLIVHKVGFDKQKFLKACGISFAYKHPANYLRDASEDTQWEENADG
jgi:hypothetical protein